MEIDQTSYNVARVDHALMSLAELIPYTSSSSLPARVQIALLEAWFNNYRLLTEFLTLKPAKNMARAADFVGSWTPPIEARDTLLRDYGVVSQSVTHFGKLVSSEWGEVDPPALREKATHLFKVFESFVAAYETIDDLYAPMFRRALRDAMAVLASQS
jgi:hypothetical protein